MPPWFKWDTVSCDDLEVDSQAEMPLYTHAWHLNRTLLQELGKQTRAEEVLNFLVKAQNGDLLRQLYNYYVIATKVGFVIKSVILLSS